VAFDVVEGANHPAGSAFDAIFKGNDDFLLGFVPDIDFGGAGRDTRFVLALFQADIGGLDFDVRRVIGFIVEHAQLFINKAHIKSLTETPEIFFMTKASFMS
jgi:hypothetical protein